MPKYNVTLDESHVYRVDGIVCPSVTQILSRTGLADYSSIPHFMRDFALERGSAVHKAAHYYLEGDLDEETVDPIIQGYIRALDKFVFHSDFVPEPGTAEQICYDPMNAYCGTWDIIGSLPQIGRVIVDFKCGMMPAVHWQLAAYGRLADPPIYNRIALRLSKDGTYKPKLFPASTFARHEADFLAARRVYGLLEGATA